MARGLKGGGQFLQLQVKVFKNNKNENVVKTVNKRKKWFWERDSGSEAYVVTFLLL